MLSSTKETGKNQKEIRIIWDREALTALVASPVGTGEAETNMGVAGAAASGDSTASKLKQKAAALSWPHTGRYGGSCGWTDFAAFAPKICLVLVGADWERHRKSQGDEPLEMLKCSTFTP